MLTTDNTQCTLTSNMPWIALWCCRPSYSAVPRRPWSGKACRLLWRVPELPRRVATGTVPSAAAVEAQPIQRGRWSWREPAVEHHRGQGLMWFLDWCRVTRLGPRWKSKKEGVKKMGGEKTDDRKFWKQTDRITIQNMLFFKVILKISWRSKKCLLEYWKQHC